MKKFPLIKSGQVILMRADTRTGHVLDESFIKAGNNNPNVYTVLNSFEEGANLVNEIVISQPEVECVIYDKNKTVLLFLRPEKYR